MEPNDVLLPAKLRSAIYIIVTLGTALLVPLNVSGIVSDTIMSVWTSLAGAATGLAALNIHRKQ